IPSNVVEEGDIIINCKMLCDIARKLPKDVVEFVLNEKNNVSINCLNSDYTVVGLPANEYPDIPEIKSNHTVEISAPVLKSMINKTIFAVSTNPDEVRKVLKGSLFEIENNNLTVVSVDLYRLAMIKKEIKNDVGEDIKFIVPGKTLNDIKNMLSDDEENTVTIYVGENQAMFDCGNFKLTTRLIDGEYFSYKQIIPKQFKSGFTVDGRSFIKTIERVEPIIDNVSKNPIRLNFVEGKIKVKCETQIGKVNDLIECDYSDDEMIIGFNYKYIHDAVVRCEDEKIQFKFNSPFNPVIIDSPEDDSYLFMVLPVRL
ncbi:MAG: DNA polymerase III subunit beta, partial [Clostridia bacterium]